MSYMNDPREMAIRPESGVTLEQDNRVETFYHWGAMVTDLCDLPVSEYMKPMTVIVYGSGGGGWEPDIPESTTTESVKIWFRVLKDGNEINGDGEQLLSAGEDSETVWTACWEWVGSFSTEIKVAAIVQTENSAYTVSAIISDNNEKKHEEQIVEIKSDETVESYKSYGVASVDTPVENVTGTTYTEVVESENIKYNFEVSSAETIVYLTLKLNAVDNYTNSEMRYGDEIPFSEVSIDKEGYDFLYWVDSKGNRFTGTTMPSNNLTLTAKYEVKKCNVTFIYVFDDVEEVYSSMTVNYGSTVKSFPSTSKVGYDFQGWEPAKTTVINGDTEFRAIFTSKEYTVTWSGYTDGPLVETYKYNELLVQPEDPVKDGYTFNGWDATIPEKVTKNLVFKAKFTINKYKIEYFISIDGDKGLPVSSYTQNYGTKITLRPLPVQDGYSFTEWSGYEDGMTVPSHDVEFITERTTNVYTIYYYVNGELNTFVDVQYGEEIPDYEYVQEGYTVTEWEPSIPETMPAEDLSVYCSATVNTYELVFVDQDGNEYVVMAEYGTTIGENLPVIEGKTFVISEEEANSTVGVGGATINGVVEVNNYKTIITINGETVETSLPYGTNIREYIEENYPAEEGHTLVVESNYETVPSLPEGETLEINVSYIVNVWVLSYATEGLEENESGEMDVEYGASVIDKLPVIEAEGHTFNGWFVNDVEIDDSYTMPDSNLSVVGQYEKMLFNVTIYDENDNVIFSKAYEYKTNISSVLNAPEVVEYVNSVVGYDISFNLNDVPVDESMEIVEDLELFVVKTPKQYVLTFMNGDEIISAQTVDFESIITYPPMDGYIKDGVEYVFVWEDTSYNGQKMPNKDLEIKGEYQQKAEAPIYFGTFNVKTADYDSSNTTQYFDATKLETEYFGNVEVSKCVGDGAAISVPLIKDEYYASLNIIQQNTYKKENKCPYCFVLPNGLVETYAVNILDGANVDHWSECVTDGEVVTYNGNEYQFFVYYTDSAYPVKNTQTMGFTIKLTKK